MKLCFSNIGFENADEARAYALLKEYGYTGLEIAPSKFTGSNPYDNIDAAAKKATEIREKYSLCIPSMQSIWYGQTGNIFEANDAARLADYTKKAVLYAKAVGCKSLVFGCPKNRLIPEGQRAEDAIPFFEKICAFASANGVRIALEANPAVYGTNFINTTAQAFSFAQKVSGLFVNYDLGTCITNDEDFTSLAENAAMVSHVHISMPALAPVEQNERLAPLAAVLKSANYSNFVSIEMKTSPFEAVETAVKTVAEIFT